VKNMAKQWLCICYVSDPSELANVNALEASLGEKFLYLALSSALDTCLTSFSPIASEGRLGLDAYFDNRPVNGWLGCWSPAPYDSATTFDQQKTIIDYCFSKYQTNYSLNPKVFAGHVPPNWVSGILAETKTYLHSLGMVLISDDIISDYVSDGDAVSQHDHILGLINTKDLIVFGFAQWDVTARPDVTEIINALKIAGYTNQVQSPYVPPPIPGQPQPPAAMSWLHKDGKLIKDQWGTVNLLRGVNEWATLTWAPDLGKFQKMKDLGCEAVRINIRMRDPSAGVFYSNNTVNYAYLDGLDLAVAACRAARLYIVLNMHQTAPEYPDAQFTAAFFNNPTEVAKLREAWILLANRYVNESTVCAYDYCNEPDYALGNVAWQDIIQPIVEQVRAINPNVLHLVEISRLQTWPPYAYDPMAEWRDINFLKGPNVVLGPHGVYYHYLRSAWSETPWVLSYEAGDLVNGKAQMRDWMNLVFGYYKDQGIPVINGECGCWMGMPGEPADPHSLEQWRDFLALENETISGYMVWVWLPADPATPGWGLVDANWNPTTEPVLILSDALAAVTFTHMLQVETTPSGIPFTVTRIG
jgi:aryl-phospho-beta-D-glucosidase BglC (GH1 family)